MTESIVGPTAGGADTAAVIDIGSNTIHLLVADCHPDRIEPIRDRHVRSGLGIAVASGAALGTARIRHVAEVVSAFAIEARECHAREIFALGTHAVRSAPDRCALTAAVEAEAGVTVRVLSPEREAMLCLAGAALGPMPDPPFLCADIGGGSCDLVAVGATGVRGVASLPVGSGVLAAQDLDGDPPSAARVEQAATELRDVFGAIDLGGAVAFPEAVFTGGAARRLRSQIKAEPGTVAQPTSELLGTVQRLLRTPSPDWPHAVKPERAPLARAGGMILRAIVDRWHIPQWRVSPYGLREGALAQRAGLAREVAAPVSRCYRAGIIPEETYG